MNPKQTFHVSARVPVYRFVIGLPEGRAGVVERVQRAIERQVDGTVRENEFAFRPRATWFGSTRSRPRVQGHIASEREGTSVHVSVHTDPSAWTAVFFMVAVLVFGTFQITFVPPFVSGVAAVCAATVFAVMSHLAEGSRMASWVRAAVIGV